MLPHTEAAAKAPGGPWPGLKCSECVGGKSPPGHRVVADPHSGSAQHGRLWTGARLDSRKPYRSRLPKTPHQLAPGSGFFLRRSLICTVKKGETQQADKWASRRSEEESNV
jgi:hypothetical protein